MQFSPPLLFSVIIPTYNRANLLTKAIESVETQLYEGWELIIVDDGSTDNTSDVCQNFLADPRVKYIFQQNKELNGARNTGIQNASGTFCCFLDDDDYFLPNHLQTIKAAIDEQPGFGIYKTKSLIKRGGKIFSEQTEINNEDALIQHWEQPSNLLPLAINTTLLQQQPFNEQDLLLDDFVWLSSALVHTSCFQCAIETVVYVEHATNRTKTYHSLVILPKLVKRLEQAYQEVGVRKKVPADLLIKRTHHLYLHQAHLLSRQGHLRLAFNTWRKGVRSAGFRFIPKSARSLAKIIIGAIRDAS